MTDLKKEIEGLRVGRAEDNMKDPNDFGKFQEGYNQCGYQTNKKIDRLLNSLEGK